MTITLITYFDKICRYCFLNCVQGLRQMWRSKQKVVNLCFNKTLVLRLTSSFSNHGVDCGPVGFSSGNIGTSVLDFLVRWMMISATKEKREISIPTNHIPRGRWKCSILRASGSSSSGSSLKRTSVIVNPAWNIKMYLCNLLK